MQELQSLVFGPFRLDLHDERLWRGREVLPLRPKPLAVLRCLVTHAGQLVTKDALLEAVWPETAVSESALAVVIRHLRRVLSDHARTPQFIETVHRRGYRFVAPVAVAEPSPPRYQTAGTLLPPEPVSLVPSELFVGREGELAQVHQWFTTALQGKRQVGIIAGEPGIGKTAVVNTFVAQVSALEDLRVGHGQCVESYGAGEPYLPVLEALGRLGREPDGTHLVSMLRQYAPSWLVQMPALLPRAEWEALQCTLGNTGQTRMLRELTEALDALTLARPLVLVLEDLHWSDRATLEWLAYVARRPDPARLLILGTYRPVDAIVHVHPLRAVLTELRQHGQCVEVALDYLSEAEVASYLGQRFEDPRLAADLAHVLHRRTTGNPLFLIALVDELVRQQVVQKGPVGWEVRAGMETITAMVPATLRALIELQLAHLRPEDQMLLEAASVAGVEFAAAAVAAAVDRGEEAVEARCTALAHQGQFLHAGGHAEWPDGTVTTCYDFRHALYQEVLYQRVPAGRQSRWHARIGIRLARGFGENAGEMAAALAMHLVRGRLLPQAMPYLRQAGQQAFQRAAYQEAVAFYEQALQALEQVPTTPDTLAQAIDLRFALRGALWPLAEFGPIVDHLRAAESLAETLQDQRRLAWSLSHLTGCFRAMGENRAAIESGQRALTLASALKEIALQAATTLYMGIAYRSLGDYDRAIAMLTRTAVSLEGDFLYERFDLPTVPSVSARAWLAYFLAERGEFTQGIAKGEEAVQLAEAVDDPSSLIVAYAGIGGLYLCKGDLHQAISALEHGLRICQATMLENLFLFGMVASRLGYAYALSGRIADALPLLEQATEWAPSRRAAVAHRESLAWLGESYLMAGRQDEAMNFARQGLELSRASNERGHQAYALRLLGEIAAQREPPESALAEAHYRQAQALADELGMRPLKAHCHRGLGTLYSKEDRREQACAELATAIELYRVMDMTFWLPQAETTMASRYSPSSAVVIR
jgi:DNA-binding winged helix-turn-helix (wHTH) protein/tetratricopeptide (TPR) repeat protein